LFGAFFKKIGLISALFSVLVFHLIFSVMSGIFTIVRVYDEDDDMLYDCAKDPNDNVGLDDCKKAMKVVKPVMIAIFVVVWLFELCESVPLQDLTLLIYCLRRGHFHCEELSQTA
jgi:hypothetical protein